MKQPAVKPFWVIQSAGVDQFVATSEEDTRILTGAVLGPLIPLLDGSRDIDCIVSELIGEVCEANIRSTLEMLDREGFLTDGPVANPTVSAWWDFCGVDAGHLNEKQQSAAVDVVSADGRGIKGVTEALQVLGIRVTTDAALRIVIARDYRAGYLEEFNTTALRNGTPWLMARPFGRRHWLGPLLIPGRTACWKCLARWLLLNGWTAEAAVANLPATAAVTYTMLATEAAKWVLAGNNAALEGQIRALDTVGLTIESHPVHAMPHCPACGGKRRADVLPRLRRPREVANELRRWVSPLTGIVRNLKLSQQECGLYVAVAEASQVLRPDRSGALFYSNRQMFEGKGQTEAEAEASCLGEAVERYSIQFHADEQRIRATSRELDDEAVDVRRLMSYSDGQYRTRDEWNQHRGDFQWIPEPWDDTTPVEWVEATSLTTGKRWYVPAAYCYLGYGLSSCAADSNGCAAGNTFEEAWLRGLLELVERDAVALWWYNRVRLPALSKRIYSDRIAALIGNLQRMNQRVRLIDLTNDLGIPVCAAVSTRADGTRVVVAAGSGLDPETAAWRALADAAHSVCSLNDDAMNLLREGSPDERDYFRWLSEATLQSHPYLSPNRSARHKAPLITGGQLGDCVEQVRRAGLDILTVDMTRPEIGFPVARIIVPGLRHWWARFAPGRLYDVPVSLAWRKRPISESDLNPVPFFR
jgi:ribosomal protein S12 methylthiotransferase accessory factor